MKGDGLLEGIEPIPANVPPGDHLSDLPSLAHIWGDVAVACVQG